MRVYFPEANSVHLNWLEKVLLSGPSFKHKIVYNYPTCAEMRVSQPCEGS